MTPLTIASNKKNNDIVNYLKTCINSNRNVSINTSSSNNNSANNSANSSVRNSPDFNRKIYLDVPFVEKDIAKSQGASFDSNTKRWYFTNINDSPKFERWRRQSGMIYEKLSDEQKELIDLARDEMNVLVDACIGSGKTTAIQVLCDELPEKQILYLTYNRLLKVDAKNKIHSQNAFVTNYHGFAYHILNSNHINGVGVPDLIQAFLANKDSLTLPKYDLLLIDEYQDIEKEIADMLEFIKLKNPGIQIIAVGDMKQKIYNKTTLDVSEFIDVFLDTHEELNFTKCFRLNAEYAARLGRIWKKKIIGVNNECEVRIMNFNQIAPYLAKYDTSDILCLGARIGPMSALLNILESQYSSKFNKRTVYASILDEDRSQRNLDDNSVAIFTTYDSSKGLERKICVIFDFSERYWNSRSQQVDTKYEILRNIFCVAASRGKNQIIFVEDPLSPLLHDDIIATPFYTEKSELTFTISDMFSFKYIEDVEECYRLLSIERDQTAQINEIEINRIDGQIDLSPCIGILQEASFFNNYNIDDEINFILKTDFKNKRPNIRIRKNSGLEKKVLYYVALQTRHERYVKQVDIPFVGNNILKIIHDRMSEVFTHQEQVQVPCRFAFYTNGIEQECIGVCDVLKDDTVWELKFTSDLTHEHYLQCASYMIALDKPRGVLWNVRTNERIFITIPDRDKFVKTVIKTITMHKAKNVEFFIET